LKKQKSASYDQGKKGESNSWEYLLEYGYTRPTSQQRKNIVEALARQGKQIKIRGFDLVETTHSLILDDVEELSKVIDTIKLFELKTAGANRKASLKEDFSGMGFTLTSSEKENAELLGDNYRFLLLNLKNKKYKVCKLQDFFKPQVSRIYPTWSIFIKDFGHIQ